MAKAMFPRDVEYWRRAINQSDIELEQHRHAWDHYLGSASGPYYARGEWHDHDEGTFGTNWHYPEARTVIANVYSQDPSWEAINPNPEYAESALAIENLLQNLWFELQWNSMFRIVLYYAYFTGFGAIKTTFIPGTSAPPVVTPSQERVNAVLHSLGAGGLRGTLDGKTLAQVIDNVGAPVYQNLMERRGFPHMARVRSSQFLLDPDVVEMNMNEARWQGERLWLPLEYVHNAPLYDERTRRKVEATGRRTFLSHGRIHPDARTPGMDAADEDWVELVEIFDKANREILTMQMDQGLIIRKVAYPEDELYDVIHWNPVPEQKMPLPDAALVFPHAEFLDSIFSRITTIADTFRQKALYDADMVKDPDALVAFLMGDDGAHVPVEVPDGKKLSDALLNPDSIPIPPELLQMAMLERDEIRHATGAAETRTGAPSGTRKTATQVRFEESGTTIRFGDKQLEMDNILARRGTQVANMVRRHWSPEMIAAFSGQRDNPTEVRAYQESVKQALAMGVDPNEVPVVLPRMMIRGQFIVRPTQGSTTPVDKVAQQQQDRLNYMDMLMNPMVDNFQATYWYFTRRGINGIENFMPPKDQAMQQAGMGNFAQVGPTGQPEAQGAQGTGEAAAVVPNNMSQLFGVTG